MPAQSIISLLEGPRERSSIRTDIGNGAVLVHRNLLFPLLYDDVFLFLTVLHTNNMKRTMTAPADKIMTGRSQSLLPVPVN